ncbi:transcriptional regulator, TetR family [Desulfuromusa kysingii]|uniref:Transcriptional regulator, TetR family n=1 Tax=Desulfuromusa kysingii TaxID=37625 RepID=A0A1H3W873_9BACT|nr:TetR/AcrR family transcriptional regulator [Desulfuromusa kysingii]SDZ83276.1 transcriptional regulator, TetR family [Desulfuromusa kysingii]
MARNKEYMREEVLDAATQIFWVKGFKGTAVSDLVAVTGLNKHSMYQEFGNKEGLFRECLDNYVLKINREETNVLSQQPLGLNNIEEFFRRRLDHATSSKSPGCLLINSAIEKELLDEEAFKQVEHYLTLLEESFYQCLLAEQKAGGIPPEKDCRALAFYLLNVTAGMMVMSKTAPDKEKLTTMTTVALAILKN